MELWDIYDADKKLTGRTMKRNDWCLKNGEYHLTVLGVVARPDGKFLITKRVMTKAWAPGWWEVSGGAAQAGEASYDAVLREVREVSTYWHSFGESFHPEVLPVPVKGKVQAPVPFYQWPFEYLQSLFYENLCKSLNMQCHLP